MRKSLVIWNVELPKLAQQARLASSRLLLSAQQDF